MKKLKPLNELGQALRDRLSTPPAPPLTGAQEQTHDDQSRSGHPSGISDGGQRGDDRWMIRRLEVLQAQYRSDAHNHKLGSFRQSEALAFAMSIEHALEVVTAPSFAPQSASVERAKIDMVNAITAYAIRAVRSVGTGTPTDLGSAMVVMDALITAVQAEALPERIEVHATLTQTIYDQAARIQALEQERDDWKAIVAGDAATIADQVLRLRIQVGRCHALLQGCQAALDPEKWEQLNDDITGELTTCQDYNDDLRSQLQAAQAEVARLKEERLGCISNEVADAGIEDAWTQSRSQTVAQVIALIEVPDDTIGELDHLYISREKFRKALAVLSASSVTTDQAPERIKGRTLARSDRRGTGIVIQPGQADAITSAVQAFILNGEPTLLNMMAIIDAIHAAGIYVGEPKG